METSHELDLASIRTLTGVALTRPDGLFSVLDFWGRGGPNYFVTRLALPTSMQINWAVVETEMAKESKKIESEELRLYSNTLEALELLETIDAVYSSGALHCCEYHWIS